MAWRIIVTYQNIRDINESRNCLFDYLTMDIHPIAHHLKLLMKQPPDPELNLYTQSPAFKYIRKYVVSKETIAQQRLGWVDGRKNSYG